MVTTGHRGWEDEDSNLIPRVRLPLATSHDKGELAPNRFILRRVAIRIVIILHAIRARYQLSCLFRNSSLLDYMIAIQKVFDNNLCIVFPFTLWINGVSFKIYSSYLGIPLPAYKEKRRTMICLTPLIMFPCIITKTPYRLKEIGDV